MRTSRAMLSDIEDCVGPGTAGPADRVRQSKTILPRALRKRKGRRGVEGNVEDVERPVAESFIPGTQSVYVKTWGCSHNTSDGEYMAGMLAAAGYSITDSPLSADLWLLNSCTVKGPSEDGLRNSIRKGKELGKPLVICGCVPQAQKNHPDIVGLSVVGVQQIDRVVEVVEETLKGNTVRLYGQRRSNGHKMGGAPLSLPKIRRNPLVEIIAINTGCLNQCTYCKTKHARGDLGSYPPQEIVERAKQAFSEGVVEVWLTSEDLGAYGHDIGVTLPQLLWQLVPTIPEGCMLRLGMTNPPYIMDHLEEMAAILCHPRVYSFLHVPVQCGSDCVLAEMRREYTVADFRKLVDYLRANVPEITIATDIICGFPTETEEVNAHPHPSHPLLLSPLPSPLPLQDFAGTLALVEQYQFPSLFINQFYPRPGTPAATMRRIPTQEVKARSRALHKLFHSYQPHSSLKGTTCTALITEHSSDGHHMVGHDKPYRQVLVPHDDSLMGKMVRVRITSTGKHYLMGEVIDDPQVVLPSRPPPLPPGVISGRPHPQPVPRNGEQMLAHSLRGQSTLDRLIIAIVVSIVCWLIVQHVGQLVAS